MSPHVVITVAIKKKLDLSLVRVKHPRDDNAGSNLWAWSLPDGDKVRKC